MVKRIITGVAVAALALGGLIATAPDADAANGLRVVQKANGLRAANGL